FVKKRLGPENPHQSASWQLLFKEKGRNPSELHLKDNAAASSKKKKKIHKFFFFFYGLFLRVVRNTATKCAGICSGCEKISPDAVIGLLFVLIGCSKPTKGKTLLLHDHCTIGQLNHLATLA
ncbi:MAG: hypothetical protein O7D30_12820, partial [Rickettsia endosymbiont of Ixodes persulcatus]|nr:hypothetical protein [Rickettsia endosymbiont of Ixodes persulcatus]